MLDIETLNQQVCSAARFGNVPELKSLLKQGANPNAKDALGASPLEHAIREGKQAAVDILLEAGADLATADSKRKTAFYVALRNRQGAILSTLLARGYLPPHNLFLVNGEIEFLHKWLSVVGNANFQDDIGRTVIHWAAHTAARIAALGQMWSAGRPTTREQAQLLMRFSTMRKRLSRLLRPDSAFEEHLIELCLGCVMTMLHAGADPALKDSEEMMAGEIIEKELSPQDGFTTPQATGAHRLIDGLLNLHLTDLWDAEEIRFQSTAPCNARNSTDSPVTTGGGKAMDRLKQALS